MDSLMNSIDMNCAALHLDPAENLKSIRRKWKHRRSRSTSNLLSHQGKVSDSDDDGADKDRIDSDDAERSLAKLSLQSTSTSKCIPHSSRATGVLVESDSFNEFFGGSNSQEKSSNGRRRRRHKRIAIDDPSSMNDDSLPDGIMAPPKEYSDSKSKFLLPDDAGKRKRNQREKALVAAAAAALPSTSTNSMQYIPRSYVSRGPGPAFPGPSSSFQTPDFMNVDLMTMASEIMDEDMKSDDESSSISSNDECIHESCDEGREGDDEHSDWVGDEWMEDAGMSEMSEFVMLRRFRDRMPSREIRAGKRRVHPNKPPVFSIRTSYNEQLSKFLQDPDERQLTLHHRLKKEEITQLSNLASLYSLQLNAVKDDQGLNCHILMKTPHTTQMDGKEVKPTPSSPIVSESDTKRVKI